MGRGRAKAKQIRVARKLKYSAPETDLSALERELHSARGESSFDDRTEEEGDLDEDPYAAYADGDDEDEDDYGQWASGSGH